MHPRLEICFAMKPSAAVLTLSTIALALGVESNAQAQEVLALSFELQPRNPDDTSNIPPAASRAPSTEAVPSAFRSTHPLGVEATTDAPLAIPAPAMQPPIADTASLPTGEHGGGQALALSDRPLKPTPLPQPPEVSPQIQPTVEASSLPQTHRSTAPAPDPADLRSARGLPASTGAEEAIDSLLGFNLTPSEPSIDKVSPKPAQATGKLSQTIPQIFQGGPESLVARAVGSAEGTRTPEGERTAAYFGHIDPGNRAWNLGTFSYQHRAKTPEDADARQLRRLVSQTKRLKQQAKRYGLSLSLEELLNGVDLANQAPLAALDRQGYVEWLAQAHKLGMTGSEAIVWARTRSFIDPDTQRWNAPGLGNNIYSISQDQSRRASAIAQAIKAKPLAIPAASSDPAPNLSDHAAQSGPDEPNPAETALRFEEARIPLSFPPREISQPAVGDEDENKDVSVRSNSPAAAFPTSNLLFPSTHSEPEAN